MVPRRERSPSTARPRRRGTGAEIMQDREGACCPSSTGTRRAGARRARRGGCVASRPARRSEELLRLVVGAGEVVELDTSAQSQDRPMKPSARSSATAQAGQREASRASIASPMMALASETRMGSGCLADAAAARPRAMPVARTTPVISKECHCAQVWQYPRL